MTIPMLTSMSARAHLRAGRTSLVVTLGMMLLGAVAPATADVIISAGAGVSVPYDGDIGYSVLGSIGSTIFSDYTRLEAEFEYREVDRTVDLSSAGLGRVDLPIRNYDLRGIFRFVFRPDSWSPYVGVGAGIKLLSVDDRALKRALGLPSQLANSKTYGVSFGLLGLLGIEVPLFSEHFKLFGEARADYSWEMTDGVGSVVGDTNAGAFSAVGGLRYMF